MIEDEVGRLASEKSLSLDRLILEVAMKVFISVIVKYIEDKMISVIVKYIEDKMQFCCSHMPHEVNHVLAIRLAAQRQLELIHSLRAGERIHACWELSECFEPSFAVLA